MNTAPLKKRPGNFDCSITRIPAFLAGCQVVFPGRGKEKGSSRFSVDELGVRGNGWNVSVYRFGAARGEADNLGDFGKKASAAGGCIGSCFALARFSLPPLKPKMR